MVAQKKRKIEVESDAEEKKTPSLKKQASTTKAKPKTMPESESRTEIKPAATRRETGRIVTSARA